MSQFLKLGIFISYGFLALILGIYIYDSITGSSLFNLFKGARGGFFISATIMLGTVFMLIGAVSSAFKYQKGGNQSKQILLAQQVNYLNKVLNEDSNLSIEERENINRKINNLKNVLPLNEI